jgi:hypothetical protein
MGRSTPHRQTTPVPFLPWSSCHDLVWSAYFFCFFFIALSLMKAIFLCILCFPAFADAEGVSPVVVTPVIFNAARIRMQIGLVPPLTLRAIALNLRLRPKDVRSHSPSLEVTRSCHEVICLQHPTIISGAIRSKYVASVRLCASVGVAQTGPWVSFSLSHLRALVLPFSPSDRWREGGGKKRWKGRDRGRGGQRGIFIHKCI